ncbi:hypothetical protein SAMN04515667_0640 [Formosa sp. Hel1_31_208]|uniref:hypothetical protein n=1 Tax=Formosa sp. Hel1_31_208 TaxID=1798225 RepID=UPI00087CFBF9|nr:hypothetical protein [Formosa sp. Hel1_31_208]SDR77996.1 hypothetical protein SAMN04515667_0640 [Formosa sp. Hel1_31_208]
MKYTMFLLFLVMIHQVSSQSSFIKDSLSIIKIIKFQGKVEYLSHKVSFEKLISDSRCPKDVMCIRAGEAKVLISVYKNDIFLTDKEVVIHASGYVTEENNLIFVAQDFKIFGINLTPYPQNGNPIPEKDYNLEIVFHPK